MNIIDIIAKEVGIQTRQAKAAIELLDGGATVPFIARYRKEATDNLDDVQLRLLEKRLQYLRDFEARQNTILQSIEKQGLLTRDLQKAILATTTLTRLEDLYLPYKPKRTSKATLAAEAGLAPLARSLRKEQNQNPEEAAVAYLNPDKGFADVPSVLAGAQEILIDYLAEDADLLQSLRDDLKATAVVKSDVVKKKMAEAEKFQDYFDFSESYKKVPSHRALAMFRGQSEGFLRVKLLENMEGDATGFINKLAAFLKLSNRKAAAYPYLLNTCELAWKKILKRLQNDFFQELRLKAEEEAIAVFGENLRDLLLAAPAGGKATLGLDPGIRTGVKVAVVDQRGKLLETAVIYPHAPQNRWQESIAALAVLADKHKFELIAIGNGTGSRETEKLVADLCKQFPQLPLTSVVVSEAGASVYSASELASLEFPNIDVSLRGAVSIARRLQDPLAELVKIEPKAIGVGQYQHDVNQGHLDDALVRIVEDCVNHVGVDINTASVQLLTYVAGLNAKMATEIVKQRDALGAFTNREQLKKIKGIGPKSFEQAAGFLRIPKGSNPLDASAVHPESYALVEKILAKITKSIQEVLAAPEVLADIKPAEFADATFGKQTVADVIEELKKPGRDPRPSFKTAKFKKGVNEIHDLREGMILEGVVSNVTNFGAFVDIGVHQDGLVHISALAEKFVDDPRKVVKAGQIVQVKVLDFDVKRKRISLTMRLADKPEQAKQVQEEYAAAVLVKRKLQQPLKPSPNRGGDKGGRGKGGQNKPAAKQGQARGNNKGKPQEMSALAAAFAKASKS
ncbi:MAG: RNA-binding transcriptional accessory protein [Zetaproteobacteria bacterium CG2_30_46_52]|nr:MAG: RNA-binding transcriptional accessory protein [Zetaproteobacteria bacterium CG2_30_46_52]